MIILARDSFFHYYLFLLFNIGQTSGAGVWPIFFVGALYLHTLNDPVRFMVNAQGYFRHSVCIEPPVCIIRREAQFALILINIDGPVFACTHTVLLHKAFHVQT